MSQIHFTVYVKPVPQGSARGVPVKRKDGHTGIAVTTDNAKLRPFRSDVTQCAEVAVRDSGYDLPMAGKHVPVEIHADFFFAKPASAGKKRPYPSVKPDVDKLARSLLDSMTHVVFADDAQVIAINARKHYGTPERVEVTVTTI